MEKQLYSKTHSLVNLSSSILKHYGVTPFHSTIQEIDDILTSSNKKNICVILFDALGKHVRGSLLGEKDSINRREVLEITSVFPPTTVAATNAFLSAKYPYENGWLGWKQHFNDLNITIDMFSNTVSWGGEKLNKPLSYDRCSYDSIIDLINKTEKYKAYRISPKKIMPDGPESLNELFKHLDTKVKGDNQFIYTYWDEPDHSLHEFGTSSLQTKRLVKSINVKMAKLAKNNPQTLFIVISDHDIIDITFLDIEEHKDLYEMLEYKPSVDSRALMIKLKNGNVDEFKSLFKKYYGDGDFLLYTKEEIIKNEVFGFGTKHKEFDNFLGDLLIISLSDKTFLIKDDNGETHQFKAAHSGGTKQETIIGVSIYNQ